MTYAEARRMAGESLNKIQQEKSETLKETSKWKQWSLKIVKIFISNSDIFESLFRLFLF